MVLDIDDKRQVTHRLTSGGGAVLTYDEDGNTYMTSVQWFRNLLDKKSNGNMIKSNFIGKTDARRFNPHFDSNLVRKVDGDPLSREAGRAREMTNVKVSGDDW